MTPKLPAKTITLKPRKKRSQFLGLIFSLITSFLALRLSFILDFGTGRFIMFLVSIGSALTLLFYAASIYKLYKEKFVGFFISSEGFNDISTGNTYGIVQWKDVTGIKIIDDIEHQDQQYIVVKVKNPQDYIDREYISFKKRSLTLKYHYYGSPICFSNRALVCSFDELFQVINDFYENYQIRKKESEKNESV